MEKDKVQSDGEISNEDLDKVAGGTIGILIRNPETFNDPVAVIRGPSRSTGVWKAPAGVDE